MASEERRKEVETLLIRVQEWAGRRPDVVAVGLAGSWARGNPTMESDVDLVALTTAKESYLESEAWIEELGGVQVIRTHDWGPLYTERRSVLPTGLEVEFRLAPPEWAATDPPDPDTGEALGNGGLRVLYDPEGVLTHFIRTTR